jgi:hypothetical protein
MKRLAAIALAVAAAACGGSSSAPSTVATNATVTTETFNGTVQPPVNGVMQADSHNFTETTPGQISITLTAAGPPPTIKVGVGVGQPNTSNVCVLLSTSSWLETPASTTPALSGGLTTSGTYCVVVFDTGNVLQPVTYSVTVSHT